MTIPPELEAQILRYYHAEKWRVGTIATQLNVHHSAVSRVLSQAGLPPLGAMRRAWALPPRIELLKYTETETTRKLREKFHVVQDMLMPIQYLKQSIQYFNDHFKLYPLWLSPMAIFDNDRHLGFVHPFRRKDGTIDEMYVDIGAYGTPLKANFDNSSVLPLLEKFVIDHQGYQALYAKTTLSREDFRTMFDHSDYDQLRERLPFCRQAFDEVYDKVSSKGRVSPVEMRKLENRAIG